MKSILISGSRGFVGNNLSEHLKNQYQILNLGRTDRNGAPQNYTWTNLNPIRTITLDAIIHLAGKAHDLKKSANDSEYFTVNTGLTEQLFNVFIESDSRDFIYFSSVKAVADTVDNILMEDVLANPMTPYGKSKQLAEQYLLSKTLPKGKRLFIIRPCMIHGPGNKGNLNLLYSVVKKGIPYPLAAFNNKRSFLSIANLNYIIERLISDETISGGVYNVSDDEPLSTNQVIEIISDATGRSPKLWKINKDLVKGLASIGDKLHLPLNSERLKKLTESYVVSNDKIKAVLGIEKLPVSSIEGLISTIKSFSS